MKKQLIIISLDPLPSRYTLEWFSHLPKIFQKKLGSDYQVIQINGQTKSSKCTQGGFLDFEATNMWKSEQISFFFRMMKEGQIQDDAIILFTDAWNPTAIQLKYTKDLCKKNWKLIGIWHAGSYDPNDFLGRIDNKVWAENFENSLFSAYDLNWFATDFHVNLWKKSRLFDENKIIRSGFPMEYIPEIFNHNPLDYSYLKEKEDMIVFPARIAPEKQPHIFEKIAEMMPEYKFVMCCKENMNKEQYHETLRKSKLMLSFSLQETLGITQYEGMAAKCFSLVPNHLSYSEMYPKHLIPMFTYPSDWITSENINYDDLKSKIKSIMNGFEMHFVNEAFSFQTKNFFSCDIFIDSLRKK